MLSMEQLPQPVASQDQLRALSSGWLCCEGSRGKRGFGNQEDRRVENFAAGWQPASCTNLTQAWRWAPAISHARASDHIRAKLVSRQLRSSSEAHQGKPQASTHFGAVEQAPWGAGNVVSRSIHCHLPTQLSKLLLVQAPRHPRSHDSSNFVPSQHNPP